MGTADQRHETRRRRKRPLGADVAKLTALL
jgi:hypothetical protein